jgi:hypothetical protein
METLKNGRCGAGTQLLTDDGTTQGRERILSIGQGNFTMMQDDLMEDGVNLSQVCNEFPLIRVHPTNMQHLCESCSKVKER